MPRQVTVTQAAKLLGVSRRTIERRLKAGLLTCEYDGNRRLVTIPDELVAATMARMAEDSDGRNATVTDKDVYIARLEAALEAVRSERDYLRALLEKQAQALAERALPAPALRHWWQFWKRT